MQLTSMLFWGTLSLLPPLLVLKNSRTPPQKGESVFECGIAAEPQTKQLGFFEPRTFLVVVAGMLVNIFTALFALVGFGSYPCTVSWFAGILLCVYAAVISMLYYAFSCRNEP